MRVPRAAADQAGGAAGAGGDLPEGDGEAAGGPVRDGARPGGGRAALAGRRAGDGLAPSRWWFGRGGGCGGIGRW